MRVLRLVCASVTCTSVLFLAGCGSSCAGSSDDRVNVWRIQPPNVSTARAESLATALGFSGETLTSDSTILVRGNGVGPSAGPATFTSEGGTFTIGTIGAAPIDRFDLSGPLDANGAVSLQTGDLPSAGLDVSPSARLLANLILTGPGTALIDPRARTASLTLPLRLDLSCVGTGCVLPACSVDLGTVTLTTTAAGGDAYVQFDGTLAVAGTFAVPAATAASCAGGADPAPVNSAFGLPDSSAGLVVRALLAPAIVETGPILEMTRDTGSLVYQDRAALLEPGPTTLPSHADAETAARTFLDTNLLLPPDAVVSFLDDDRAVRVVFAPRLALQDRDGAPVLVPVEGADVTVSVANGGRIVALDSRWRPATLETQVSLRSEEAAWTEAQVKVPWLAEARDQLHLEPRYAIQSAYAAQAFFDPIWWVQDDDGHGYAPAAATDFTPRVVELTPEPGTVGGTVTLHAAAAGGLPPYTFTWRSNLDGPLGSGDTVNDVALSSGKHMIGLSVADARGTSFELWYPLERSGSAMAPDRPHPRGNQPIDPGVNVALGHDLTVGVGRMRDRASPQLAAIRHRTTPFLEAVYLEQWRYTIVVTVDGQPYSLRSDKCIVGALPSGGACYSPPPAHAVPANPSVPTLTPGAETSTISTSVVFNDLPGTFTLSFNYQAGLFSTPACEAQATTLAGIKTRIATGSELIDRSVGGQCPGIKPEVQWTFLPPVGMTGQEIIDWCGYVDSAGMPLCDVPPAVLEQLSLTPTQTYDLADFEASLYTAVVTQGPATTQVATLFQDTDDERFVGSTLGAIDRSHQPPLAQLFSDAFIEIRPIDQETSRHIVKPNARADFDNFHSKAYPYGGRHLVTYPGCNHPLSAADFAPCVHIHESWFGGAPASQGQDVYWIVVRDHPNERFPRELPNLLISDHEPLFAGDQAEDLLLWHHSQARATQCNTAGPLDNTGRPCVVFPTPIFFSH